MLIPLVITQEDVLKPFRVTKYDENIPAADLVNRATEWLNNQ